MKTLSEKLRDKMGQKVKCDYCGKKKPFNENWRMATNDGDRRIVCPDCTGEPALKNKVLVGI